MDTVSEYCEDIKTNGVRRGLRSDTWCIAAGEDTGNERLLVVSGMHLIEAVYKAHGEEPTNPQVRATIAAGVLNVTVFQSRTPTYIARYLVDQGNSMNKVASVTSHIEKMKASSQLKVQLIKHLDDTQTRSRDESGSQGGYEKKGVNS